MTSANFRNPAGLVLRMLTSGRRAAYDALIHEALRVLAKPLDTLLSWRERGRIQSAQPCGLPILLVVGAPRSGTTLVYQTLARYLDVSYVSNLTSLFPKSPISATRLFRWLPRRQCADFRNFYGQTARLDGPNDGFSLWNNWLGDDRYIPRTDLTDSEQQSIRQFFDTWGTTFGKPFLNKNNRNTGCLNLLSRVLPQASFIVIRRNPLLVAQSLIRARKEVQGDASVGWGLHSQCSDTSRDPLSYVDDVCDQILQIEQQLDEQLRDIPEARRIEITYEGFCEDPVQAIEWIHQQIPGTSLRTELMGRELQPFEVSAAVTLSETEKLRLLKRLQAARVRRPVNQSPERCKSHTDLV